jgi:hypothetical protein
VENRPRNSNYRGPLLIHASAKKAPPDHVAQLKARVRELYGDQLVVPDEFPTGELIGVVEMVDCTGRADSPWADRGLCHLVLENARAVAPGTKLKGKLGIWNWTVGTVSEGWARKDKGDESGAVEKPKRARRPRKLDFPAQMLPIAKGLPRWFADTSNNQ